MLPTLALNKWGAFFWEGNRQALKSPKGGQLSRLSYSINYDNGEPRLAFVSIKNPQEIENLQIKQIPPKTVRDRTLRPTANRG